MSNLPPLSPEQQIKPRYFEARIALVFAVLYLPAGVHLPFFPLWLESKGFGAEQIAMILSVPMFLRVFTTPLVTAYADYARDRVNVFITVVAAAFLLSLGYFFTASFTVVMLVSILLQMAWTPHGPLTDSLALSGVRRFGSNYAHMRIFGSASFLAANFIGGFVIAAWSESSIPVMISVGLGATLVAAFFAPRLGRPRKASPLSATDIQKGGSALFSRYFLLCALGGGVVDGSHGFMYAFVSIYWKSLGISDATIGTLWTLSVAAEVLMFFIFTRLFGRVSPAVILFLAGIGAMLRWTLYPSVWDMGAGVTGFAAVQCLHALSTALYLLGLQKLIAESIPEDRGGAAQGLAFFANGFFMAIVTLISGAIYNAFGVQGFYLMTALALFGTVLIVFGSFAQPHRSRFGG